MPPRNCLWDGIKTDLAIEISDESEKWKLALQTQIFLGGMCLPIHPVSDNHWNLEIGNMVNVCRTQCDPTNECSHFGNPVAIC
jgi:hypothetical protein